MKTRPRSCTALLVLLPLLAAAEPVGSRLELKPGWTATGGFVSPYATQAAAADERFVYVVSNTTVAQYDRVSGQLLGTSTGPAEHLNSAFVWQGKVYCAHSNYPNQPDASDLRVFDPATRELTTLHRFERPPGSLTWCVQDGAHWWCCFAHYQHANAKTVLVKLTAQFEEVARWTFPKAVVDDWDGRSASGGLWQGNDLLVSHHHYPVLYRLRVPVTGGELVLVEAHACPFPGQGIAADPQTGGLVGIDRKATKVVFAARKK